MKTIFLQEFRISIETLAIKGGILIKRHNIPEGGCMNMYIGNI